MESWMNRKKDRRKKTVAIVMGSKSDWPKLKPAAKVLQEFGVHHDVQVVSAHRTPEHMQKFALEAGNSYAVIIAGAGGAAHLPGMVASLTHLPVIGVPVKVGVLGGLDALLSVAQMPAGVPVATMAVDGAKNAGLLAVQILALNDVGLQKKVLDFRRRQRLKVRAQRIRPLKIVT
jgi:5-(carboxyamino)imidazole ribonucleotide mutase